MKFKDTTNLKKTISEKNPIPVSTVTTSATKRIENADDFKRSFTYLDENDIVNRRVDEITKTSVSTGDTIKLKFIWGGVPGDYYIVDVQTIP